MNSRYSLDPTVSHWIPRASHRRVTFSMLVILLLPFCIAANEVIVMPEQDKRARGVFFVEECLSRGITNTVGVEKLQDWAVKELETINVWLRELAANSGESETRLDYEIVLPDELKSLQKRIPSCKLHEANRPPLPPELEPYHQELERRGASRKEVEELFFTIRPEQRDPRVIYWIDPSSKEAVAISFTWWDHGITVGNTNYVFDRRVDIKHRVSDGVYTWAKAR